MDRGVDETGTHLPPEAGLPADADPDIAWVERSGPLFDRVAAALDEIRPALQEDGGDVELVELEDRSIAVIRMLGKCQGCPLSEMTVRNGVELHLRGSVPEILSVDVRPDDSVPDATFVEVLDRARLR